MHPSRSTSARLVRLASCLVLALLAGAPLAWAEASVNPPQTYDYLYIRVIYPDDPTVYISEEEANEQCRRVSDFFAENSYNRIRLNWTITEPLMMPHSWQYYYDYDHIFDLDIPRMFLVPNMVRADAIPLARAAGYDTGRPIIVHSRNLDAPSNSSIFLNQASDPGTLAHEFGHVVGAPHSFAWDTGTKGVIGAKDWQQSYNFGRSSAEVVNYGDLWCTMGSGGLAHFALGIKIGLGWLNQEQYLDIDESGKYRIHAYDQGTLVPGQQYGFRVRKNGVQVYNGAYRANRTTYDYDDSNTWLDNGLVMWMEPWDSQFDDSAGVPVSPVLTLLDMTPFSQINEDADRGDGTLLVGRTYSDEQSGVHITPTAVVDDDPPALDVVVNLGWFEDNSAPTMGLRSSLRVQESGQILADRGQTVRFEVTASDADGDELAYFWDFGDGTNSTRNRPDMEYAWSQPGLYNMRVEVSDMKGGKDSMNFAVNVGLSEYPALDAEGSDRKIFWGRGRILDQQNRPVQGVRVWIQDSNPRVQGYTDGDGRFILANVDTATEDGVIIKCFKDGWRFHGLENASPLPDSTVAFNHGDLNDIDFLAYKGQRIRPELCDIDGNPITEFTAEGLPVVDESTSQLIVRLHREGPEPAGEPSDPKYIGDIRDTQLAVRLFPAPDVRHDTWLGEYLAGNGYSGARALYRRVITWHDTNWSRPLRNDDPYDNSVEFAVGGTGNDNPTIPSGYSKSAPLWPDEDAARAGSLVTAEVQPLRRFYVSGNDGDSGPDVVQIYDPDNADKRMYSASIDYTPDGKAGSFEKYVWFHTREHVQIYNDAVDAGTDRTTDATGNGFDAAWPNSKLAADHVDIVIDVAGNDPADTDTTNNFVIPYGLSYWAERDQLTFVLRDSNNSGDDAVRVAVSSTAATEKVSNSGALHFSRSGSVAKPVTIRFTVVDGSAVEGEDFEPLPRQVVIPAEERFARLPIIPINDSAWEGNETFVVTIQSDPAYAIATASTTCTIVDDEKPQVNIGYREHAWERGPGGSTQNGEFILTRYGNLQSNLRVHFSWIHPDDPDAVAQNMATPSEDYDASASHVDFPPYVSSVIVPVAPVQDSEEEGDEVIGLRLEPATAYNVMDPVRAGVMLRDGALSTISIEAQGNTSVPEDSSSRMTVVFRRSLADKAVAVFYTLRGTADYGDDYRFENPELINGEVVFRAGVQEVPVEIAVYDDSHEEDAEDILVNLIEDPSVGGNNYNVDPDRDSVAFTIRGNDDNEPLSVTFASPLSEVEESDQTFITDVEISKFPSRDRHDYNTASAQPDENLLLVDYVVREAGPGELPDSARATGDVDFVLHRSEDVGVDRDSSTNEPVVIDTGTIYFKYQPNGSGRSNTRVSGPYTGTVKYTIKDDTDIEDDEIFVIELKKARLYSGGGETPLTIPQTQAPGALGAGKHVVRIKDNDRGIFALTGVDLTLDEGVDGDTAVVRVERTGDSSQPVDLALSLSGTAGAPADFTHPVLQSTGEALPWYIIQDGQDTTWYELPFAAGETSKTIVFTVVDDEIVEPSSESATLFISRAPGAQINGSAGAVTMTVADDDSITLPVVWAGFENDGDDVATEGAGEPAVLTLYRDQTAGALQVQLVYGDVSTVTEEDVEDFQENITVTFADGEATATVPFMPAQDSAVEGTETLVYGLVNGDGMELGEPSGARIIFLDDDDELPEVSLTQLDSQVTENDPSVPARILVHREGIVRDALTVDWTVSGTATIGTDYNLVDFQGNVWSSATGITIPAGMDDLWLHLTPVDDAEAEGEESVRIALAESDSYVISDEAEAVQATIVDDDRPTVHLVLEETAVTEGSALVYTLSRAGGDMTVGLTVALSYAGSADGSDYTSPGASVTIPANQASIALNVPTTADTTSEPDETVIVSVDESAAYARATAERSATGTILDDDRPRVWIEATVADAFENDPTNGTVNGQVRLTRSVTAAALDVRIGFTGSARIGTDYQDLRVADQSYALVSFAAGQATADVDLVPIDDDTIENIETIIVSVLPAADDSYNLGSAALDQSTSAEVDIVSDDVTEVIVEALSDYAKLGMTPWAAFRVTRQGSTDGPLRVNFTTSIDSTARRDIDYNSLGVTVDLADGQEYVEIPVEILQEDDTRRTLTMTIRDPTRSGTYSPGDPSAATITILATGDRAIQLSENEDRAIENPQQSARLAFAILPPLDASGSIPVSVTGSATAGDDYTVIPAIDSGIPVGAGASTVLIEVQPFDDGVREEEEDLTFTLTDSPDWFVLGQPAEITITDEPIRSLRLRVLDEFGNPLPTTDYYPTASPVDGTVEIGRDSYLFDGLRASELYEFVMDQSAGAIRSLQRWYLDLVGGRQG